MQLHLGGIGVATADRRIACPARVEIVRIVEKYPVVRKTFSQRVHHQRAEDLVDVPVNCSLIAPVPKARFAPWVRLGRVFMRAVRLVSHYLSVRVDEEKVAKLRRKAFSDWAHQCSRFR